MSMTYDEILKQKEFKVVKSGFIKRYVNNLLFPFQRDIVRWALRKGKCALFEDTGLGKTAQQLVWAYEVSKQTKQPVLILAPLAVSSQTIKEGKKFGVNVKLCKEQSDVVIGVNITNYEKLHKFDTSKFIGVVLDESSILKSYTGKTTNELIERFADTPYKLCCTATPSPNDYTEIGTTAEFLGVMKRSEMLSMFFINDVTSGSGWRLKGHSENDFYRWIGTWAIMIKKPSNLGYSNDGYELLSLEIVNHIVESPITTDTLFVELAETLSERREARKNSLDKRVSKAKELIEVNNMENCLIWCDFNDESKALKNAIDESIEVKGSDTSEHKETSLIGFAEGDVKYLVSKPSIAGFGMNWQNCHNIIFVGLSDSYEMFYQAIRRCYRFGQKEKVIVHVIISEAELNILQNIKQKQAKHEHMTNTMIALLEEIMQNEINNISLQRSDYNPTLEMCLL